MRLLTLLLTCSALPLLGATSCQPIAIQHAKVAQTDQANYILTVSDTDPHLAAVGSGGLVQNSAGNDIVFSSDSQGVDLLHWDPFEVYNPLTGQLVTHVAVGTLSHTADTTIYRCVKGSAASSFQGGAIGAAWPASYKMVDHLARQGALQLDDSTSNANTATSTGVSYTNGIIGGGAALNGTSGYINVPHSASLGVFPQLTIALWVRFNAQPAAYTQLVRKASSYFFFSDGTPLLGLAINNDYAQASNYSIPFSSVGVWSFLVATYDSASSVVKLYWNGSLVSSRVTANSIAADSGPMAIGALPQGGGQFLNGSVDEVRITSSVLSADRIATEYNNQSSPATFYTRGAWSTVQTLQSGGSQHFVF